MRRSLAAVVLIFGIVVVIGVALFVSLCGLEPGMPSTTPQYTYTIVNTYPHDPTAFTEGLEYKDDFLFESTGLNGQSTLRRTNLTTGEVLQEINLSNEYFGEGLTIEGEKIVQLTYLTQVGFIYDKTSFSLLGNFTYKNQGWGLTHDRNHLVMSDGSEKLTFLNPETYQMTGQIQVHDGNLSITNLNELEYINGNIYANIFTQAKIAIINPQTGTVTAWIDLTELANSNPAGVLNGIAYDSAGNRLFITGKNWSHLYQIQLHAPA